MTTPSQPTPVDVIAELRAEAAPLMKSLRECVECRGGQGSLCEDCNEAELYAYVKLNAANRIEKALGMCR